MLAAMPWRRPAGPATGSGLLAESAGVATGYLLLEDGSFLLLE